MAIPGCSPWIKTRNVLQIFVRRFHSFSQWIPESLSLLQLYKIVIRGIIGHKPAGTYGEVRTCITSGSCTRLSAWEKIGGFDEKLFIDSVDFDFCYRIRKTGYVIIQTREAVLEHSIGEVKKNKLLGIPYSEHSAFRYYYISKNNIYYPLKNRLYLHALRGNARNMRNLLQVLFFEEDKKAKLKQIARGWVNGYK